MKYVFIFNPLAGAGGAEADIRAQIEALENSADCEVYVTKAPGDGGEYAARLIAENPDEQFRFIACGGDGTINEVFSAAVGAKNASVSCYPCGSGNDFVKSFGGAEKFLNVEALVNAPERKIDVLKVGDRYSINVTNFGFDTAVAITVSTDREKNGHGSKSSYAKGVVLALIDKMKNHFTVTADGEVINPEGIALLCTVANGQYVGGSFKCAPRAKLDDGLMELCLVQPISRLRFVKLLPMYIAGEHLDRADVQDILSYHQAKLVEVDAPEGFAYSLDGEIIYETHFTIEIVPAALNFACPE